MIRKRPRRFRHYYNIFLLIVILVILFVFGRKILSKNSIAGSTAYQEDILPQNKILVHAIHHVLPGGKVRDEMGLANPISNLHTYLIDKIITIDFKNPVSFVQNQLPGGALYADIYHRETQSSPIEKKEDITFLELDDLDENKPSIPAGILTSRGATDKIDDRKNNDIRERDFFLIGQGDLIDSLDVTSAEVVDSIKKPQKIDLQKGLPHILIYHTHGTESYKPASEGNFHSLRKEYSVMEVGRILKKELEKAGFNVIHDESYHDYPSYSGSYNRSLERAKKILNNNPSIKIVLDIHRDGYDNLNNKSNKDRLVANNRVTINNELSSRFQLVIGPEAENKIQVENFANFIRAVSDAKYAGFSKPILVKPYGRYNQFLTDYYALIEVGSNVNTIEEARVAAYYLADVLRNALELIER